MKINNNNPLFNLPTAQEIIAKLKSGSGNSSNNKKTIPQIVDEFIKVTPIALKSLSPTSLLSSTQDPALTTALEPAQVSQQVKGINFDTKSQGLTNEREKSLTEALDKLLQVPFARDIIKNLESKGLGSDNNQIKVSIDNFEPPFATASNSVSSDGSNIKFQESYFDNSSTDTLAYTLFNELFDIWGRTTFGDAPYTPEFQALGSVGNKIVASYFSGEELDKNDLAQVFNGFYSQYNDYFSQYGIDKAASTEFSDLDKATQSLTGGVFTSFYGKDGLLETALKPENNPPQALINDYVISTTGQNSTAINPTVINSNGSTTNQPDLLNISTNINSNALIVQPGGNAGFSLNNYNVSAQPTGATRSYTYTLNNQTQTATTKAAFETAVNTAIAALPVNNASTAPYQLSFRVEDNVNDPFFGTTTNTTRFVQRVIVNGDTTGAGLVLGSATVNEGAGLDSATKIDSKDANGITAYSYSIDGGTTKTYTTSDDLLNALDGDVAALTGKATPYQIAFSVKDSLNTTKTYSPTSLTVVNLAPTIAASDFYIGLDGTTANVKAVDPEGKALTYLYEINTGGNNWVPVQTNTNVASGTNNTYDFKNVTSLASGAYSVRATVKDSNNQSIVSETRSVTLPNKAPTVGGFTLSGTNNLTATVTGTDPEGDNPLSYEFLIETAPGSNSYVAQQPPSASNTYTYNTSGLTTGQTYKVAVIIRDSQNHASPVTLGGQIIAPNKAPSISSFQVAGNTTTVTATDPDNNTPLSYEYQIENPIGNWTSPSGSIAANTYTFDTSNLNSGNYNVRVKAKDSLGAETISSTQALTVANKNPVIGDVTLVGNTLNLLANGPEPSDTLIYKYQMQNGSNWEDKTAFTSSNSFTYPTTGLAGGSYNVRAIVRDQFGNETISSTKQIVVGNQAPKVTSFSTNNNTATVSATDPEGDTLTYDYKIETAQGSNTFTTQKAASSSNSYAYDINNVAYTTGQTIKVQAVVTDSKGNAVNTATDSITIPNRAPIVSSFTTGGSGGATATVNATDPQGDTLAYDYQIETAPGSNTFNTQKVASTNNTYTYDVSGLTQGNYKVQSIVKDPFGNQAVSNSSIIAAPGQSPIISNFNVFNQTATVNATDGQGESLTYSFEIETAPNSNNFTTAQPYGASNSFAYDLNGTGYTTGQQYKVRALVKDASNNISTSSTQTIVVPQKAPTISSFTTSGPGGLIANVTATDPQGDTLAYDYQIETAPGSNTFSTQKAASTNSSYVYDATGLAQGSYKVQAIAKDPYGNQAVSNTSTISVSSQSPTINSFGLTGQTATVSATDPQGDALTYAFEIETAPNSNSFSTAQSYGAGNTYTYNLSGAGYTPGQQYKVRALVKDAVNNVSTSTTQTITVPQKAPTINSFGVSGLTATVGATDPQGDSVTFEYQIETAPGSNSFTTVQAPTLSNSYTYNIAAPSFTSGQVYKVQAIVRDPQNNATTTGTQTITVPQKAPTVSNFSMTGLTANVTATDPQGDPITYDYQILKNGNWETVNSTTSPTYTYSTTGLQTGQTYNTRAIANDNQGNATTSSTSSISFLNQAPTIASINVAGASVIVNATDPNTSTGDTLKYTYKYFNGTSYVAQVSNVTSNTYSYVGFAPGTLPVLITVTDSSGLTADSFATLTIP